MIWSKACPHCNGDLCQVAQLDSPQTFCLGCGYVLSPAEEVILEYARWPQPLHSARPRARGALR